MLDRDLHAAIDACIVPEEDPTQTTEGAEANHHHEASFPLTFPLTFPLLHHFLVNIFLQHDCTLGCAFIELHVRHIRHAHSCIAMDE